MAASNYSACHRLGPTGAEIHSRPAMQPWTEEPSLIGSAALLDKSVERPKLNLKKLTHQN